MMLTRVVATTDGSSRLEDFELPMSEAQTVAQGFPPMRVSDPLPVAAAIFVQQSRGASEVDWHPAPRRQLIVMISGSLAVQTGDATRRKIRPGDVVVVEDTTGKGHLVTPLTDDVRFIMLPLREEPN